MRNILVLFAVLALTSNYVIASGSFGAIDAGAMNQRYTRDLRTHEFATRAKSKSAIVTPRTQTMPQATAQQQVVTSELKSVLFINNSSIPSSELLNVIANKINKPMTVENISAIRKDIMRYYQSKGYFSAVAMVTAQDFQTGSLTIEIKEGGKNSIIIQE